MRITKLEADNFKYLRAVSITPDGSAVVIGGKNEQGKSSTLDAIEAALGGKKHEPAEPIRRGESEARVVIETETIIVTRTWGPKGSALEVRGKDGSRFAKPQKMLDELIGPLSFDPLEFVRDDAKSQAATLRALVGLDFTQEDLERADLYDKRRLSNREAKRLEGAVAKLPAVGTDVPAEAVSVADLTVEIERRRKVNEANASERKVLMSLRDRGHTLNAEILDLGEKLHNAKMALDETKTAGVAQRAKVDALTDENVDEVLDQIEGAEEANDAVRDRDARNQLEAELSACVDESGGYTETIDKIDKAKADAAAAAKYPIEGLVVTDNGVEVDGIPFDQVCQSGRLRAAIAIGLALNPELKIMLIRDGAFLDEESLGLVASMADEAGAQVWIEVVGDRDGVTVIIEEGSSIERNVSPPPLTDADIPH
jgi:DNA repair exonuclease SbcCD ATPase subunit